MFQDLHRALLMLKEENPTSILKFNRNADYYLFDCELTNANTLKVLKFELEICKVYLLKMHALRMKRKQGDFFDFQVIHKRLFEHVYWG
jgi:hypothetical protein